MLLTIFSKSILDPSASNSGIQLIIYYYPPPRQLEQDSQNPPFDVGHRSEILCIGGLAFYWLIEIAAFIIGLYLAIKGNFVVADIYWSRYPPGLQFAITGGIATNFNIYVQELAPLGLNILVTMCNDITQVGIAKGITLNIQFEP